MKSTIIGITGGSGSGKTYLANQLVNNFGKDNINVIKMDSYYKDLVHLTMQEREVTNFDHPDAFEFKLLINHLEILSKKGKVQIPIYDYKTHTRTNKSTTINNNNNLIILEGIYALFVRHRTSLLKMRFQYGITRPPA